MNWEVHNMYLITQKALEAKESGICYAETVADYYTHVGSIRKQFASLHWSVLGVKGNGDQVEDAIAAVAGEHPDGSMFVGDLAGPWIANLHQILEVAVRQIDTYHHRYVSDWRVPLGETNDYWGLPMATVENFTQAMILLERESGFASCVQPSLCGLEIEVAEDEDVNEIRDRMMVPLNEEMERSRRRWDAEEKAEWEQYKKDREKWRADLDDPLPF